MKRIFIGSFITDKKLQKNYPKVKKIFGGVLKGRWSPFENLHITYKFLGDTQEDKIVLIKESLKAVLDKEENIKLIFRGFGVFPNIENPRVFFLKVENPDGKLSELNSYIQSKLSLLGYPEEKRPFIPHITLKRPKYVDKKNLFLKIKEYENTVFGEQLKIEINVIQSILSPNGAKYIKI